MRSLNSSDKIEEFTHDVKDCRWDALLLSETWKTDKAEIWESQQGHVFMGAGKFENRRGVGTPTNKKWRKRINWTDHSTNEPLQHRSQSTSSGSHQCVCTFPTRDTRTNTSKKCTTQLRSYRNPRKYMHIVGGDFNAELGPGIGIERLCVGMHTLNESNSRGAWLKQWLILREFVT